MNTMPSPLFLLVLVTLMSLDLLAAEEPEKLLRQARQQIAAGKFDEAHVLLSQVLEQDASNAVAHYIRGRVNFQRGKMKESVKDFDRYIKLQPAAASRQWERGIALYYAGQFDKGAEQFELYQTFHDNDVENSVWRFLCMVPADGVKKARSVMLPIKDDRRVPMMKVYDMFRGLATVEDVLADVERDQPGPDVKTGRLFYAHLYIGLFLEATGKKSQARKYIALAADEKLKSQAGINSYMWDVARIHHQLRARAQ
jgi:lipoprotein NlpI